MGDKRQLLSSECLFPARKQSTTSKHSSGSRAESESTDRAERRRQCPEGQIDTPGGQVRRTDHTIERYD